MAFTLVQHTNQRVASGANAKAFASNNGAGNLLICGVFIEDNTATVSSITDSAGNTWTACAAINNNHGYGFGAQLFYAKNSIAGANTVTVTPSAGSCTIAILEYSGADTGAPLDATANANAAGASSPSSGNITTTTSSELLIGWIVSNVSQTVGSGYVFEEQPAFNFFSYLEDKTSGAPGSYLADSTGSSTSWIAWIAAF